MPPEIVSGAIGFIGAALAAGVTIMAFAPRWMDKRVNIKFQERENHLESEKKKLDNSLEEAKQQREEAKEERAKLFQFMDAAIKREETSDRRLETMTEALVHSVEIMDGMRKELRANTNVTTGGVEAIGELSSNFAELLEKGSKPLQALSDKVESIGKDVVDIKTNQASSGTKIEGLIAEINAIRTSVEVMLKVAEAKLQDARKGTTETPVVNLNVTTSPAQP